MLRLSCLNQSSCGRLTGPVCMHVHYTWYMYVGKSYPLRQMAKLVNHKVFTLVCSHLCLLSGKLRQFLSNLKFAWFITSRHWVDVFSSCPLIKKKKKKYIMHLKIHSGVKDSEADPEQCWATTVSLKSNIKLLSRILSRFTSFAVTYFSLQKTPQKESTKNCLNVRPWLSVLHVFVCLPWKLFSSEVCTVSWKNTMVSIEYKNPRLAEVHLCECAAMRRMFQLEIVHICCHLVLSCCILKFFKWIS